MRRKNRVSGNGKRKWRLNSPGSFTILFIFIFLVSSISNLSFFNSNSLLNNDQQSKRGDVTNVINNPELNLFESPTITSGTEVYENVPTWFNGTFYNPLNKTEEFTSAYLETEFDGWSGDLDTNESLYCNNSETQTYSGSDWESSPLQESYLGKSDYLIEDGVLSDEGNLDTIDFDNFTIENGNVIDYGGSEMVFLDNFLGGLSNWTVTNFHQSTTYMITDSIVATATAYLDCSFLTDYNDAVIYCNADPSIYTLYVAFFDSVAWQSVFTMTGSGYHTSSGNVNNAWLDASSELRITVQAHTFFHPGVDWIRIDACPKITTYLCNFTLESNEIDTTGTLRYFTINTVFKSNITAQTINIFLYNYISENWVLVNSSLVFNWKDLTLNYTIAQLIDYLNNDKIKLKFEAVNATNSFKLFVDNLNVTKFLIAELDISLPFENNFTNFGKELLAIEVWATYKTNISQIINLSVYNMEYDVYELINSSSSTDFYANYYLNETTVNDLFTPDYMYLRWEGSNLTNTFTLTIDSVVIKLYYKLELSILKTFDIKGNYRHRWHVFGSDYYSNWTYFTVIEQPANLELISESPFTTRWDFMNDNSSETVLYQEFFDNLSQGYWDLYNVQERDIIYTTIRPHSLGYVGQGYNIPPETESFAYSYYGTLSHSYFFQGVNEGYNQYLSWVIPNTDYLKYNYTQPTNVSFYADPNSGMVLYILEVKNLTDISLDSVHNPISSITNITIPYSTLTDCYYDPITKTYFRDNYSFVSTPSNAYLLNISQLSVYTTYGDIKYSTGDYYNSFNTGIIEGETRYVDSRTRIYNYLTKNYMGNSFLYCQTNITETLSLRSPNNISLDLQTGDEIEVTFNTTSSNRIELNILNSGNQINSFILSNQGNTNYNTRTMRFSITDYTTIDQLEFSGTFDNGKNLIVDSVRVVRKNPIYSYYVDPDGYKLVVLPINLNFTIYVYENSLLVDSFNILSSINLQTLIYNSIISTEVYITFYDSNNEYLSFNIFKTYVNYTLGNITYNNVRMSSNVIFVDSACLLQFSIYDSFDSLIRNYQIYEIRFIDITLNIYSLKLKNECSKNIDYNLTKGAINKLGELYPNEIKEFSISSGSYNLNWLNLENDQLNTLSFTLLNNKLITFNTTYRQIYFSIFNFDGFGIDSNSMFKFYINNTISSLGFNTITSTYVNLKVKDYWDYNVYDHTIKINSTTFEYDIGVQVYTLILNNNYTHSIRVEIYREGFIGNISQIIPAQTGLPFRFYPLVVYNLVVYYTNGTEIENRTITLDKNNKLVSFGFYSTEVPEIPESPESPKQIDNTALIVYLFIGLVFTIIVIVISLIIVIKRHNKIPKDVREKYKYDKPKSKMGYSNPADAIIYEKMKRNQ